MSPFHRNTVPASASQAGLIQALELMADSSFFKELHSAELARRDSLNASLSFPVGILGLAGGAVVAMSAKISTPVQGWKTVLALMLFVAVVCLVTSAFYLVRAYWNYTYKYLPLPDELLSHRDSLIAYHLARKESKKVAQQKGIADFLSDLEKTCAAYGRINALNNESKAARIFRANSFLVVAIAAAVLCAPIYWSLSLLEKKEPSKVQITNAKEFSLNTIQPDSTPRPTTQQAPKQPEPVRPSMPPGREIKEYVVPNKRK